MVRGLLGDHGAEPGPGRTQSPPRLLSSIAGLLEIAGVDLGEAWRGKLDADELDLGGEAPRDLGTQIAPAVDSVALAVLPEAERLHPHDPGYGAEAVADVGSA